uniref:NUC153 domain-containing protein n=1 Tax=Macrostomum lignano TaxID=282301 RepID=A0A1I8JIR7_9PLAT
SLPDWLSDRKKRQLRKADPSLRQSIQLVQDLAMPNLCNYLALSPDQQYLFLLGVYKPRMNCYELANLSLKFERCIDSPAHKLVSISEDYSKLALLEAERWLELHSQQGHHYKLRVPAEGRDLAWCSWTGELIVATAGQQLHRLNLELGRFMQPWTTEAAVENYRCAECPQNGLLFVGTDDAKVQAWDRGPRPPWPLWTSGPRDHVTLGVGMATGHALIYDIRERRPCVVKDHRYGVAVHSIAFHGDKVISSDSKCVKLWHQADGSPYTAVEPGVNINHMLHFPNSDCSCWLRPEVEEQERTETVLYDNYKFLTREQLTSLGLSSLIGTEYLRAFMHGFFIDSRLYERAKLALSGTGADTAALRRERLREATDGLAAGRIRRTEAAAGAAAAAGDADAARVNRSLVGVVTDARFGDMFRREEFAVDAESEEFGRLDQLRRAAAKKEKRRKMAREKAGRAERLAATANQ